MTKFLKIEQIIEYHDEMIKLFGGLKALLESAIQMPRATAFGNELHLSFYDKASAYLFHIVRNHPFIDGNKRTGAFSAYAFLQVNNVSLNIPDKEYEELVVSVAEGNASKKQIAEFFESCHKNSFIKVFT